MTKKKKYYAVARGRKTGIFATWFGPKGAEIQIRGVKGARFKGFLTVEEAKAWLKEFKTEGTNTAKQSTLPKKAVPKNKDIVIYTDGGCINNPGPGGYGVVIIEKSKRKELSGGFRLTTNNRMELMACIIGLSDIANKSEITLYSDSQYVVNGIAKGWAKNWRSKGWIKSNGQAAVNPDLREKLLNLCNFHNVQFIWVKGHAGNEGNERCDALATQEAAKQGLPTDQGYKG